MQKSAIATSILFLFWAPVLWAQTLQVNIPRIEMMPNQPSPYNVRDWKAVAMKYDSFVYDLQKTGQYLPLSFLNAAGLNYPQLETFRLHTYVGTNSPFGNEAINVLPSLVGASLVGNDKSNQYGKNWVLMAQDFYNKNNGENIYLNSPATSSGNDWWYDMMPNVYFYQLYDLYPNWGGEADIQLNTIAERFLAAVRAMGGNESPWTPAYMNYRAWKFQTMEPNANGVPEPEAAGAFAWVLYHAWKKTGNPAYLKGAEWSIEFLDNWNTNPSYELQLPYGTLTAAKMNAELGTNYQVEKMVNWSFNKGPLRGWGTIVGTWGGFDVSGLVGEANDAGNDYAFQLNGVQQAAALVPMVRYDKRFARAIGKWMLNLANANRLFFSGFLPANLQDGAAWSAANDPERVIGHEALRQVWQSNSPFSTGDALNGGWAATNLALYGTSSIGYLGALVEKTNVDKILKINLLKTDFFHEEAYPSYLFYNSYNIPKTIQLELGAEALDIYEALSEDFILQNANGQINLTIPANEAILVVLCPANGEIEFEKNKMLVNGVVVDYRQSAQPFSWSPRIKALAAAANPLEISQSTVLYATVFDADSDQFTYQWSTDSGTVDGSGDQVNFLASGLPGDANIQCIVTDLEGNSDTATLVLTIVADINVAPQIIEVQKNMPFVAPGGLLELTCLASDEDNDPLTYNWSATGGNFSGTGNMINWTAPLVEGIYQITVTVTDDQGLANSATTSILVKIFEPATGNLVAHYPFTGNANDLSGNNLHGQPNGAILTTDRFGIAQRAYYFNGGAQHIAVPNSPLLNFQDGITVSCWIKPNALPDKETFVLSHGSWQNRWKISITPERRLRWTLNSLNGIGDLDSSIPLQLDSFYHVAVTYDREIQALYLNGQLHSYSNLSGQIRTSSAPFLMGQMLPGEANYNFKGVIDEVKIFNYALVPVAVQMLYGEGTTSLEETTLAQQRHQLLVYPNPTAESLHVSVSGQGAFITKVKVFDLAGRLILEQQNQIGEQIILNIKNCKSGIYIIKGFSETGWLMSRFVKK